MYCLFGLETRVHVDVMLCLWMQWYVDVLSVMGQAAVLASNGQFDGLYVSGVGRHRRLGETGQLHCCLFGFAQA